MCDKIQENMLREQFEKFKEGFSSSGISVSDISDREFEIDTLVDHSDCLID
jgi:hypothetical protein